MSPAVLCPACRTALEVGALRCRFCGADARAAEVSGSIALELDDETCAEIARLLEARRRLQEIAPALYAWLHLPRDTRGPEPAVHRRHRAEIKALLKQLAR